MDLVVQLGGGASLRGVARLARGAGAPVAGFLGIPFAQPPVGTLRFAPPQPIDLWTGERSAAQFGKCCKI